MSSTPSANTTPPVASSPDDPTVTRGENPPVRPPTPRSSTVPGAFRVGGLNDNDDYTATTQTTATDNVVSTNPEPTDPVVTATLVENREEEMEEQLQDYEQQLEQIRKAPRAQVITSDGRRKWIMIAVVIMALLIVGVTIGTVIPLISKRNPVYPTPPPTPSPTIPPPQGLIDLLSFISSDGGVALQTNSTPQNNALNWLAGNAILDSYSNETKIQRYVLATLYYSTNGDGWKKKTGWLDNGDECDWWNTADVQFCINSSVVELALYYNNLVGTIPAELALLSTSIGKYFLFRWHLLICL